MLDDTFLADELTVARDTIRRPPAPSKPSTSFSLWRMTTATSRGSAAGLLQVGASGLDVAGAFGSVTVASGLGDPLLADQPRLQDELMKVQRDGLEFSNPISDRLRTASRWVAPDPETAHVAERIVFDATRVVTKGVTYVATTGPFAGAALTGVDEALTFSDDLKQQGVDRATRTKAAAVVGTVTGASVAAPVAGRTVLGTMGLVAASGPAAYIGQQAAVREILRSANYSDLAEQFDPFDPIGLAVSTLVPAAFGAWGLRNVRRSGGRGPDAGQAEPGAPTVHEALGPAVDEAVDAAHVVLATEAQANSAMHRPGDVIGNAARERAVDRAAEQLSDGQPVRVSDMVELVDMPAGRAALKEFDALRAEGAQLVGRINAGDQLAVARLQAIEAQMREIVQGGGPAMDLARMEQRLVRATESVPVPPAVVAGVTAAREVGVGAAGAEPARAATDRLMALQQERPGLLVHLDDMDAPAPMAEVVDRVRSQVRDLEGDADLMRIAAECAISNGA